MTAGMLAIDGFDNREYTADELIMAINEFDNFYTLVTDLGIFGDPIPLSSTFVSLDFDNMKFRLLPTTARGGPVPKAVRAKGKRKLFEIPMSAYEDAINVGDLQNMRGFGSHAPKMLDEEVNRRLFNLAMNHQLTHEWRRIGALQGKILDSDGSTLIDLFDEFGITQKVEAFGGASSVNQYIRNVKRHIELNLKGDVMTSVVALCSPEFFDMLLEDDDIKAAYNAASAMTRFNPNIDDVRPTFYHHGVTFMEYLGQAEVEDGDGTTTTRKFIPAGDARFFPVGTRQTAMSWTAPGDFLEALNNPGQLYYAKSAPVKFDRGVEFHTQSSFLPLWVRPAVLVRGHTGSS